MQGSVAASAATDKGSNFNCLLVWQIYFNSLGTGPEKFGKQN